MDYVVIVAGGKGLRMGSDIPKQFLPVAGLPVLMRTIQRFYDYSSQLNIILVLPKAQQDYWKDLCRKYHFPLPGPHGEGAGKTTANDLSYQLADGGATRFHSVQNGLALIPDNVEGMVGVHDGVRPFVSVDVIRRCYEEARVHQAVIPVIPVVETLRHVTQGTKPRDEYRLVQTPQVFSIPLLKAANQQEYQDSFTDDASVVEAYGHAVTLVEGNRENIKITTPGDLKMAEVLV